MALDSGTWVIGGFGGSGVSYSYQVSSISFDRDTGAATILLEGRRGGDSAFVEPNYRVLQDGAEIASGKTSTARDFWSELDFPPVNVDFTPPASEFTVELFTDAWTLVDGSEPFMELSWVSDLPPPLSAEIRANCTTSSGSVRAGEDVVLEALFINDYTRELTVAGEAFFGDASDGFSVSVPSGGRETVTSSFTPRSEGEASPSWEWGVV